MPNEIIHRAFVSGNEADPLLAFYRAAKRNKYPITFQPTVRSSEEGEMEGPFRDMLIGTPIDKTATRKGYTILVPSEGENELLNRLGRFVARDDLWKILQMVYLGLVQSLDDYRDHDYASVNRKLAGFEGFKLGDFGPDSDPFTKRWQVVGSGVFPGTVDRAIVRAWQTVFKLFGGIALMENVLNPDIEKRTKLTPAEISSLLARENLALTHVVNKEPSYAKAAQTYRDLVNQGTAPLTEHGMRRGLSTSIKIATVIDRQLRASRIFAATYPKKD